MAYGKKYAGGRWIEADAGKELKIEVASYGADNWEALQRNLTTTEGQSRYDIYPDGKCPR
ncbi:hypothetical protein HTY54_28840 [Escherichia coli]|nr:hypothetical protein [Escherichia coli]